MVIIKTINNEYNVLLAYFLVAQWLRGMSECQITDIYILVKYKCTPKINFILSLIKICIICLSFSFPFLSEHTLTVASSFLSLPQSPQSVESPGILSPGGK